MTTPSDAKAKSGWKAALPILLPFVVLGMALWQFAQIPNYPWPTRELPADWTPGCDEWEVEWKTIPIGDVDPSGIHIAGWVKDHPGEAYLTIAQGVRTPYTLSRYSLLTGKELAVATELDPTAQLLSMNPLNLLEIWHFGVPMLRIQRREPLTLEPLELIDFQVDLLPTLPPTHRRSLFLIERPNNGDWYGVYRESLIKEFDGTSYWFRASAGGRVLNFKPLPKVEGGWSTFPKGAPRWLVGATTSDDPATVVAFDLLTGEPTTASKEAIAELFDTDQEREAVPLLGPSEPDRVPLRMNRDSPFQDALLLPEFSQPVVLVDPTLIHRSNQDDSPFGWPQQDTKLLTWPQRFATIRSALWKQVHPPERLQEVALRNTRLDALGLIGNTRHESENRLLTGEIVDTARIESAATLHAAWTAGGYEAVAPKSHWSDDKILGRRLECPMYTSFDRLDNGALLVQQRLFALPAKYRADTPLWRIGVLQPQATEVTWIGWLHLPPGETRQIDVGWSDSNVRLHYHRIGDQLVLYRPGLFSNNAMLGKRRLDFAWAVVPLPAELQDILKEPDV